jgi:hypothetical protein
MMNRMLAVSTAMVLALTAAVALGDDEAEKKNTKTETEVVSLTAEEIRNLTPAKREALRDQTIAARAAEYNEQVDAEADKIKCKKERRTGSRQTVRICKTMREWDAEAESSRRMLRQTSRASSNPADVEGSSSQD